MRKALKLAGGVLAAIVVTAADAVAQNPPTGNPTVQGRGGAATGRQGGRGGRAAIAVMSLTTTAWRDGAMIPVRHVQAGAELSPPLTWAGGPNGTVSHVLLVHDLDSPQGNDNLLNWLLWNIPGDATGLPEGVSQGPELPNGTRQISVSGPYFRGPAAPPTVKARHLLFEIFALDTMIDVAPVGASPAATRAAVMAAMAGHVRGKGVLFGLYGLPR